MNPIAKIIVISVFFTFCSVTLAGELLVPSQYATIQSAINDANNGDTVIIAPDTYTGDGNRDIDFLGKAITVRSTDPNDPNIVSATVIDCNGTKAEPHRGFYFHSGEDANSVLAGVTITNGYGQYDGDAHSGGGIHCDSSSPTIRNCTVANNSAFMGGGIHCKNGGSPIITNCDIIGNTAEMVGGGLSVCDGPITNCIIAGNYSNTTAGGLAGCDGPITNCIISRNTAQDCGGLYVCNGPITNCTIVGNTGGSSGGGLSQCGGPITNCIIWNNADSQLSNSAEPNYSCIQDWTGGSIGNISDNPCFVDVDVNDFHLLPDSPCIDAGDPNYIPESNETDLDGNPRIDGARIDMGAYESIMHKARLWIWPRVINRRSRSRRMITAQVFLPMGISKDEVDNDMPLTFYPGGIQATRQFVMQRRGRFDRRTRVIAFFDREEFLEVFDTDGRMQLMALGYLIEPGQYFHGSNTIRIIDRPRWWR